MQKTYTFAQGNAQPQYQQQAPSQMLTTAGFIEAAESKQATNGTEFWKLTIGGRTYNAWPEVPLDGIEVGSYVNVSYVEAANKRGGAPVKNIKGIQTANPPAGQTYRPAQNGAPAAEGNSREAYWENRAMRDGEKDLHILREASWNIANAMIANAVAAGVKFSEPALVDMTKNLAHIVEEDVTRNEAKFSPAPKPSEPTVREEDVQ